MIVWCFEIISWGDREDIQHFAKYTTFLKHSNKQLPPNSFKLQLYKRCVSLLQKEKRKKETAIYVLLTYINLEDKRKDRGKPKRTSDIQMKTQQKFLTNK